MEKTTLFSNFGTFPVDQDLWFIEGLAEYISNGFEKSSYLTIQEAIENNHLLSWDQMRGVSVWDMSESDIQLLYAEGYTVFVYLEDAFGIAGLQKFFQYIQNDHTVDESFVKIFNENRPSIEKKWKKWLKNNYQNLSYREFE